MPRSGRALQKPRGREGQPAGGPLDAATPPTAACGQAGSPAWGGGDCLGPGPRGGGGLELESSLRHIRRKKGRETNAVPGEGQRGSGWP